MFGLVTASWKELTKDQQNRYSGVYCGICRGIRAQSGQIPRMGLSYDMAFLALLLMSLYEPEDTQDVLRCGIHPLRRRIAIDNEYVRYAADMNVALAYYNFQDDWNDDGKMSAKLLSEVFGRAMPRIREEYPRQCVVMERSLAELRELERENCSNPDAPAHAFGMLLAELLVYRQDLWEPMLRQTGDALGRFIYLADAALDYRGDKRKGKYNPFVAMGSEEDWQRWEEYLVLVMARCTAGYEMLPLVQDKALLDNILYSGVWTNLGRRGKKRGKKDD